MEPVKADQILCCERCGVELQVIRNCDSCGECNITCCGQPMKLKGRRDEDES